MDLLDELAQHPLGNLKIGNHPVFHRTDRTDVTVSPAQHFLGLLADGDNSLGISVKRHDGGFVQNYPLPLHMNEGIGCAKIDGEVCRENGKNAHGGETAP